MKRRCLPANALSVRWSRLKLVIYAGTLVGASMFVCGAAAQTPPNSPPRNGQSHSQKIANPLNDLLDEAQRDIDQGDFTAAIEPLRKVIAEKPSVAYPHFQLAYVYTALQRTDDARAEYERVVAIDPKMSAAYLNLGILLVEKDPAAAIAPLKKAIELHPEESRTRFLLGVAQERSKDYSAAAESFEGASHLDPRDAETLVHLGNLYLGLHRPAEAEPKFRNVLDTKPNDAAALLGLAKSLDDQKKPDALAAYQNYLIQQPADVPARTRVLHLLLDQEKYDQALAEIDRAEAANGVSSETLRQRADIQVAQKKWDDAIATIRRAVALSPGDADLHAGLGRMLRQRRDFPGAEKELKTALTLDRSNLSYLKDLSSNFYLAGNYPAALAAMDEIAKVEPPVPLSWFIRALCYDKLNQAKLALAAYEQFLQVVPEKNSDQVWQATERSKVLRRMLENKR